MEPLPWYRVAAPFVVLCGLAIVSVLRTELRIRTTLYGALAFSAYGAVQDQVSARLCPEYFTVFHNPIPGVTDPTLLGLLWGVIGAWWGGAAMGYGMGVAATAGKQPRLLAGELTRPMLAVILGTATVALITGITVYRHSELFGVGLDPAIDDVVPKGRHRMLLVVACYHFAGYATAAIGSVTACFVVASRRSRRTAAFGAPAEMRGFTH